MTTRGISLLSGLAIAVMAFALCQSAGLSASQSWVAATTALCATWWVLEPVPIAVTSLLPFVIFPLAGVLPHDVVANAYGHHLILLLLGGFVLSKAIESTGAHRRIAIGMVRLAGGGGPRLVLGFMLASAVCSMWISNTATTLMLLPVAIAVLEQADDPKLGRPLFLGIAFAASIGGLATPIGTPPNVFMVAFLEEQAGIEISFLEWMSLAVPVSVLLVPLAWLMLTRGLDRGKTPRLPALGPWSQPEVRVLLVFAATAAAWIFRTAPLGGWTTLLGVEGAGDSTVALAGVIALFLVPGGDGKALMRWQTAESIPWGLLILFGGGIAIAKGFAGSGLDGVIGDSLAGVIGGELLIVSIVLCVSVSFMTEVVSNTATTTLLLPLLYPTAVAAGVEPMLLAFPATLSASCAFMLPVATAPNAIVFGSGVVTTREMARAGFALNLAAALVIAVWSLVRL